MRACAHQGSARRALCTVRGTRTAHIYGVYVLVLGPYPAPYRPGPCPCSSAAADDEHATGLGVQARDQHCCTNEPVGQVHDSDTYVLLCHSKVHIHPDGYLS